MNRIVAYVGQGLVYGGFAVLLGYFSQAPVYSHFPPDMSLIKVSFAHGAQRKVPCRKRTAEELAKLAPNMRKAMLCSRERLPVTIELSVDGQVVLAETLPPTGLSRDGPSRLYRRIPVPAGVHLLDMRLRDSARETGFDYERSERVTLAPAQNLAIGFHTETGGFFLKFDRESNAGGSEG